MNENRCVSCGKEIPEGSQVCLGWCKGNVTVADNTPEEELSKGELTAAINTIMEKQIEIELHIDSLSVLMLKLLELTCGRR